MEAYDRVMAGEGREVVTVAVDAGQNQPYTCKHRPWRRVGNTNEAMTQSAYEGLLLERLHTERRWENQSADWTVADLDHREIHRTVEEAIRRGRLEEPGTRDTTSLLRGLGILKDGAVLRAAVVLFGHSEKVSVEYPQCTLRIARFRGVDREDAGGCVTVRFRQRWYVPPQRVQRDVTERQQAILALLDEAPNGLALWEIAVQLEEPSTIRQVQLDLMALRMLDLAGISGKGRGARWRRS